MNSKETIKDYVKAGICLGLFILASASDTEYQIFLENRQTATSRPLATQPMEQTMNTETPIEELDEENTENTDTDTDTDTEEEAVSVIL